ncbi:IS66 family insertion sequence element accessory protein TnpA [Craterilacuibacter sp.]|uniref:IS66 family insertion sequence element accessory protein TnpA n=1 Tax=Craterilacuibacter sp. TaxID=2870909 RepID=UPI003F2B89B4
MSDPAAESRIFWQHHVEAFSRSGLSIIDYCRQHALAHSTFQRWRKLLATSVAQPAVVPVKLEAAPILPPPVGPIMLGSPWP